MIGKQHSILSGWTEIADHLGVSIRTAQRWAKNKNLPIGHPAGVQSTPQTHKKLLDRWRVAQALKIANSVKGVDGDD